MNKSIMTLGAAALIIGGLTVLPNVVDAYQGDPRVQGPNCADERHEAMENAFENNDYYVWEDQMQGRGRVVDVVTEENFARFVEAHELAEEGNMDEAKQIRAELGLGQRNGEGGMGQGMGQGHRGGI